MAIPDRRPTGGYILDALDYPQWVEVEAYVAWQMTTERVFEQTGRHPTWLAKTWVGQIEVSTVFLSLLGRLVKRPFETWVRGPGHDDFFRYDTAQEARAGHWCLVWQLQAQEG